MKRKRISTWASIDDDGCVMFLHTTRQDAELETEGRVVHLVEVSPTAREEAAVLAKAELSWEAALKTSHAAGLRATNELFAAVVRLQAARKRGSK